MREIGTQKIGSNITNSSIKRPRVTVNQRIGSRKEAISGSQKREIADKETAYITRAACTVLLMWNLLAIPMVITLAE